MREVRRSWSRGLSIREGAAGGMFNSLCGHSARRLAVIQIPPADPLLVSPRGVGLTELNTGALRAHALRDCSFDVGSVLLRNVVEEAHARLLGML